MQTCQGDQDLMSEFQIFSWITKLNQKINLASSRFANFQILAPAVPLNF